MIGLTSTERELLLPRETAPVEEWIETHRFVAEGPARGFWNNRTFPLLTDIMRAASAPWRWSKVVVAGPPQKGKTEASIINPILYALFHLLQDCAYVNKSQDKTYQIWGKKILPALEASETLVDRLLPRDEAGNKALRNFVGGVGLYMIGADSSGALSSITVPYVYCDEVDEYEQDVGGKGHPADQAAKRTRAFPDDQRLVVETSTVTTPEGRIWRELNRGTCSLFFVPCLGCCTYQVLTRDGGTPREDVPTSRLMFDETKQTHEPGEVWMQCANQACDHQIERTELQAMLARGVWAAAGQTVTTAGEIEGHAPDTRTYSVWYNAYYWPFEEWAELANDYVATRGDPDGEKDHQIHIDVLPHEEPEADEERLTPEIVAEHADDEARYQIVPDAADLVLLTVDVGMRALHYVVRAWRSDTGESWLVDAGTRGVHRPKDPTFKRMTEGEQAAAVGKAIETSLDDLFDYAGVGWPHGKKGRAHPLLALVDGGYRPDAVGWFCQNRGTDTWRMTIGRADAKSILPRKATFGRKYHYPHWVIGVNEAGLRLRDLMRIPAGSPARWHLYGDRLEAYKRHLASMEWVELPGGRGTFRKRKNGGANHWWDCEVLQIAAAMFCQVRFAFQRPGPDKRPQTLRDWFAKNKQRRRRGVDR